jgi:hypothetical protein
VLPAAVESPAQRPEEEAILSEILAVRKIVINLLYGQTAGEPLDEERMRELIEAPPAGTSATRAGCGPGRKWREPNRVRPWKEEPPKAVASPDGGNQAH